MIVPCTTLDHTVNQIRLLCAMGLREATIKNTPSVAKYLVSCQDTRSDLVHANSHKSLKVYCT